MTAPAGSQFRRASRILLGPLFSEGRKTEMPATRKVLYSDAADVGNSVAKLYDQLLEVLASYLDLELRLLPDLQTDVQTRAYCQAEAQAAVVSAVIPWWVVLSQSNHPDAWENLRIADLGFEFSHKAATRCLREDLMLKLYQRGTPMAA